MRAILFAIGLLGATTASAQMNTYRPGVPYTANPATSAQQCISQCAGDAACRGWNFVTLNESAAICEFNSQDATPIPSPNAVSGSALGVTPASDRLVRMPGSATVRIGQPAPAKPAPKTLSRPTPAKAPTRVLRQPVPQRRRAQPAAHTRRAIAPAPQVRRPAPSPKMMFRHSLDGGQVIAPPQAIRPQMQRPPQQAPQLAPQAQRPPAPRPVPQPTMQPAPQPIAQAPRTAPQTQHAPQALAPQPLLNATAAQESLFGSLYDDVAIPAPANPTVLADPDAPVATSISVPVNPVTTQPLSNVADKSGLAGG